ncbi:hypothetical protein COR50_20965 [Chitinophaga caeni]|uniref:Uncharacterized protein n=1 Tax=Chitinophaga caeni TaxID=2029983 RepID=A0A291QZR8_9BACT|nr:hypothetical protein [Chitinophaga caeni]ATL49447.1 hypothetical protein COR50_20965 [Chitinophaga caeni]
MEWMHIKPDYENGKMIPSKDQAIFSRMMKAGFQLELIQKNPRYDCMEYFYFHPSRYIQVHEVRATGQGLVNFYLFLPGGSTTCAFDLDGLESVLKRCGL